MGTVLAALALSSCSTVGQSPQAPNPTPLARDTSARGICLSGVHNTPIESIVVNRAIAAPLSLVKSWVLSNDRIDWQTFSSSLKDAPLEERVAICVFSKRDGSPFTFPSGINTPGPQASVVEIVRPNGQGATLFLMGSVVDMLDATPRSTQSLRRMVS